MLMPVDLPDGRRVLAGPWRGLAGSGSAFAVLLLAAAPARVAQPARLVRWPDLLLPVPGTDAAGALQDAHARAATERVALVCGHGRGRTGSALAVLAALAGVPAVDAVGWVRAHYRADAVETPWQRRWAERTAARLTGGPGPVRAARRRGAA